MILASHLKFYEEIFAISGFLADPVLTFGFQDIEAGASLGGKQYPTLRDYMDDLNIQMFALDLFDSRATFRHDMNIPVGANLYERFKTFVDIGSLEHIFDTRQCLENCFRLIAPGGHYMLHTPVNGYFEHGLHVFSPAGLLEAFELNGFRVLYQKYSLEDGSEIQNPSCQGNVILWLVAKKEKPFAQFKNPQHNADGWDWVYRKQYPPPTPVEFRRLPRMKVTLRIILSAMRASGEYECYLMTSDKHPIVQLSSETEYLGSSVAVTVEADLSSRSAGDYMMGIKTPMSDYVYFRVFISDEFDDTWLKI